MSKFIFKIDHYVAELFHEIYLWGGNTANHIFEGISWIAEKGILFLALGFGLFLFKRTRKTGLAILLAVGLGFLTTNIILKNIIQRARPFDDISSDFYKWWIDAGANFEESFSFPSGHTTAITAFSVAILMTTNKELSWSILFLPLLMLCSRIYLMVHYFTDCLGGLFVGSICALIAYLIVILIYKKKNKFCRFIQNFSIIKKETHKSITVEQSVPIEDFVYHTQADEQNKSSDKIENTNNDDNS